MDQPRYVLSAPVEGGIQFWEVNDMQEMYAVASIQKRVPGAEEFAKQILAAMLRTE